MNEVKILVSVVDTKARSVLQTTVMSEGYSVQSCESYSELIDALQKSPIAPTAVVVDAEPKNIEARKSELSCFLPLSRLCFVMKTAQAQGIDRESSPGKYQTIITPVVRGDVERMLEAVLGPMSQCVSELMEDLRDMRLSTAAERPESSEMILEELGNNRFFLALSPKMREIYRQVLLLRNIDISVLILGESGTGKEVVAHLLHKYSNRSQRQFVNVNCAALPTELLESELFGHVKGAFTGAISDRPGRFEQASGGTLLLDEIGEISAAMQAKLLHVLQDAQFTRLGGKEPTRVDVRILAATNIAMEDALVERTFREDLYYRLNTFTINVPPLRERLNEIPYLVGELLRRTPAAMNSSGCTEFSSSLMDLLPLYRWPGNLRELKNFVTRTVVMQDEEAALREITAKLEKQSGSTIQVAQTDCTYQASPMRSVVRDVRNRMETQMIEEALVACGWNRRDAARTLSISYRALLYKIQQYNLSPRRQRMVSSMSS